MSKVESEISGHPDLGSIQEHTVHTEYRRSRHFLRAAVVGLAAGLLAVAFRETLYWAEHTRSVIFERLHHLQGWGWLIFSGLGLAVGSFIGWSVYRIAPDASGSGIPHIKGVLIRVRRMNWRRLLPVKFVGGVLCIGVGFSVGREGPTVQMGAAIAQALAEVLRVPKRALPQLISCGAGAGLAAAFNAPLAGFIFVLEELHRELSALTYGGALIAAVCASVVTGLLTSQAPSFTVLLYQPPPLYMLPLIVLLGLAGGLLGVLFSKCLLEGLKVVQRLSLKPRWLITAIAGALAGAVAWWLPSAAGGGHAVAEAILNEQSRMAIGALALLLAVKFLMTTLCYASGVPGGIFAPMLLMGAITGALFSQLGGMIFPGAVEFQSAFAVLGMASFFASTVRAPLTGIVLILEMTGHQEYLFSLCLVSLISYLVAGATGVRPVYEALLEHDLRHKGDLETWAEPTRVVIAVQHGSPIERRRIRDAGFPARCVLINVERSGRELLPHADLEVHPGDHVTILCPGDQPELALQVVSMCVAK